MTLVGSGTDFALVRLWTFFWGQHDEVAYSFSDVDDQSLDLLMMWKELLVIIGRMLHRYVVRTDSVSPALPTTWLPTTCGPILLSLCS